MDLSAVKWQNLALTTTASLLGIVLFNRFRDLKKKKSAEKQLTVLETKALEVLKKDETSRKEQISKISNNTVDFSFVQKLDRVCYKRTGILTRTDGCVFQIDYEIDFDSKLTDHLYKDGLNIGSSVNYIGYRRTHGSTIQVIKIINYEEEAWDTMIDTQKLIELIAETKKRPIEIINTFIKTVGGQVVAKTNDQKLIINICGQYVQTEGSVNIGDYVDTDTVIGGDAKDFEDLGMVLDILRLKRCNQKEVQRIVQTQKHWVKVNYEPLEAWLTATGNEKILIVQIENQRNESLMLKRIELLEKESGCQHKNWEIYCPELYEVDAYVLHGMSCHNLQLRLKGRPNTALQIVLHFDKFVLRRVIYAVRRESHNKIFRQQYEYSILTTKEKEEVVPAPAFSTKRRFIAHSIDNYEIPTALIEIFSAHCSPDKAMPLLIERYSFLKHELNSINYRKTFELLLHMEELSIFSQFRQYDCENASFKKEGEYLSLEIENLQERRPSLTVGDIVRVMHAYVGSQNAPLSVEGLIYKVLKNCIYIKFNENFHNNYNKQFYKLQFHYSRYVLRKLHHAVNLVAKREPIFLFPKTLFLRDKPQLTVSMVGNQLLIGSSPQNWYNPCLNEPQRRAICHILNGETKIPYCIFGPPGTGKTVTVVETILQLLQHVPNARLIVGTPSNSAVDLIAQRLLELMPHIQFLRIVSHAYKERTSIPTNLVKYCATVDIAIDDTKKSDMTMTSDGLILQCTTNYLCNYRIVLGTCTTIGTLMQIKLPRNHFTHAVIDEAAQCTEPELMCVAALISDNIGQLIVAGDTKQIGPTVLNSAASDAGLSSSYMERMLNHTPYIKDNDIYTSTNGFDPRVITMLTYNYRAIPSILNVYNFLFYEEELIATLTNIKKHKEYELLKVFQTAIREISPAPMNKEPPVAHGAFFFGLQGTNMQDDDSPSWYNQLEAAHVYMIVMKLLEHDISPNDIGIISPYLKQVRLIRSLLANYNKEDEDTESLKIGTVEEFQGQERQFILISTVRSINKQGTINAALGFLKDPRRINVAISRARASLVVFGNPELLYNDPHWKQYIKYCYDNSSVYGDQPSLSYLNEVIKTDYK